MKQNNYILIIISFLSGLLISGFYYFLFDKIETVKKETRIQLQKSFFPEAQFFEEVNKDTIIVKDKNNDIIGYVVYGSSNKGYGGNINVIVAFDNNGNIKDFLMIEHNETPGLGTNVNKEYFRKGFIGKPPLKEELPLSKDEFITKLGIYPVSGATYSSLAVSYALIDAGIKLFKKDYGEDNTLSEEYNEWDDIFFFMNN
ncbi:MAG TPA: FMN-binding protein [Spirochaetota bacterium]|nr:FMN-binding protein [Spirochaetota bacterium]HOM37956.1 FMN-binding protein [Spirochaetota bacterium]HPQ48761.1 FMN-binding protein [Spirochaetota bacterium]